MNRRFLLARIFFIIACTLVLFFIGCEEKFRLMAPVTLTAEIKQLTPSGWECMDPAWSPDGDKIAFSREVSTTNLITISTAGETINTIAIIPDAIEGQIALSPDGQYLVVREKYPGGLWLYSMADDSYSPLLQNDPYARDAAWSPDGKKIVYTSQTIDTTYIINFLTVASLDVRTILRDQRRMRSPSWSVNNEIAFTVQNDSSGHYQIQVYSITTETVRPITPSDVSSHSPSWSPDGKYFVYEDGNEIAIINKDGNEKSCLPLEGYYSNPCWSPDGKHIALTSGSKGYIFNLETDNLLPYNSQGLDKPQWLPDGNAFIGQKTISQNNEIYIVDVFYKEVTQLTQGHNDRFPVWHPNSSQISFFRQREAILQYDLETDRILEIYTYQSDFDSPFFDISSINKVIINQSRIFISNDLYWAGKIESHMLTEYHQSYYVFEPSWACNSERLVCKQQSNSYNNIYESLIIFNFYNKNLVQDTLFIGDYSNPDWSIRHPIFGEHIAFDNPEGIGIISMDTYEIRDIIESATDPSWSPDGESLAFIAKRYNNIKSALNRGTINDGIDNQSLCTKRIFFDLSE